MWLTHLGQLPRLPSGAPGSSGAGGLSSSGVAAMAAVGDAGYNARYGERLPQPPVVRMLVSTLAIVGYRVFDLCFCVLY